MLKVRAENGYKDIEQVYSGSTEIDKILDKNGNVLFAVNKEVEGTPALTYKGKEETNLKNYRIYGQTVDGESVGDRTGNLFDSNINVISGYLSDDGILKPAKETRQITFDYIPIISGTYTFTYTVPAPYELWFGVCTYDESRTFQSRLVSEYSGAATFTIPDTTKYIRISLRGYDKTPIIMLNEGSTALPYEPFGYKVPVTVEGKNLCNNIWEQKLIGADTGVAAPGSLTVCCDFIPVKPNVTYSCSRTIANDYNNLRCYGTNKNYLGTGANLANKGNPLKRGESFGTFMITDARVSYIRFNDASNSLDTKYMLVEGAYTAETMPPYEPITTNLYLPEQIKMVGDEAEYIDYGEQKMHRVRKNLWSGIVEQGAVSTLGEYVDVSSRIRSKNISLSPGTYTISCNLGIRCIYAYNNSEKVSLVVDNGGGTVYRNTFTIPSGANNVSVSLRAFNASGTEINNVTPSDFIWGQIEKGSEVTTYEPYIEDTELDVTLSALPTLSGTNTLTVGTEVQPSNVYLKGRIKEIA